MGNWIELDIFLSFSVNLLTTGQPLIRHICHTKKKERKRYEENFLLKLIP